MDHLDAQKILGVSLTTSDRMVVSAAYDGSALVVGRIDALEGNLLTWRWHAAARVKDAVDAGVSVFVEEMGDAVSQHAHGLLFSDMHPLDSRPMLAVALDWYFAMMNAGAIVFAPGTERCRIMESAVDMASDDRGRNVYRVDWARVKGAHRAMMLCCLAAEGLQPVSEGYINQLYGHMPQPAGQADNPYMRMRLALTEADVEREREQQAMQRAARGQ